MELKPEAEFMLQQLRHSESKQAGIHLTGGEIIKLSQQ